MTPTPAARWSRSNALSSSPGTDLDTAPPAGRAVADSRELIDASVELAARTGRDDLVAWLRNLRTQLDREVRVIAVVGEFKAGKSELINALLGEGVCPVDDDLATVTVTAIGHNAQPTALVRRIVDGKTVVETIEVAELPHVVTESGNSGNTRGIQIVEVGLPNPVLEAGIALVDTPGTGGLSGPNANGVLRFVRSADAVLFATDAGRELTASELAFLGRVIDACPTVAVVLTKTDLHPAWRRIADLDREHLRRNGISAPLHAVSSTLALQHQPESDDDLGPESGLFDLLEVMDSELLERAERAALERTGRAVASALAQIRQVIAAELASLRDGPSPDKAEIESRLQGLREARVQVRRLLGNGIAEVRDAATAGMDEALEAALRAASDRLRDADPRQVWDDHTAQLQTDVAEGLEQAFGAVEKGFTDLAAHIAEQLEDDALPAFTQEVELDLPTLWSSQPREIQAQTGGRVETGLNVLRGSYGGFLMFSMLGSVAGIALAPPFVVGVGALFGVQTVASVRKRGVQQRREQARQVATEFVRQARRAAGRQLNASLRSGQTALEEHAQQRFEQLTATYEVMQRRMQAAASEGAQREPRLKAELTYIESLLSTAHQLAGGTAS